MSLAAGALIGFREALEAALVVGIILTFLHRTRREELTRWVWWGVAAGVAASLAAAALFVTVAGGFSGRAEQLFEGFLMLGAATLITLLILWMLGHTQAAKELEAQAETALAKQRGLGLALLVFLSVWREGVETVIFIGAGAGSQAGTEGQLAVAGAFLGIGVACGLGAAIFLRGRQVNLKLMFQTTTLLLVLFAAGLVAHGVHELQEAGLVVIINEHLWDINHLLNEQGALGSILKGLFGYNGNPSLLEVVSYLAYLGLAYYLHLRGGGRRDLGLPALARTLRLKLAQPSAKGRVQSDNGRAGVARAAVESE